MQTHIVRLCWCYYYWNLNTIFLTCPRKKGVWSNQFRMCTTLICLFNRFSCLASLRAKKKTKPLNLKIHSSVGSCENLPTQRSPLHTERSLRSFFFPSFIPSTPPVHAETPSASKWTHLFLISSHSSFYEMRFFNAFNISLSYSNQIWRLLI